MCGGCRSFGPDDPRYALCMPKVDPRLHFTLVCGAKSCPALTVLRPESLETDLQTATLAFVTDGSNVSVDTKTCVVTLSAIFKWCVSVCAYACMTVCTYVCVGVCNFDVVCVHAFV